MVNLRRSSTAEQAEITETFPRRERGAAEVRGDGPPLRRRWVPAAVRPAHRSSGNTETQAGSAHFAVCVSVLPPDRCRAQRAHRREMRLISLRVTLDTTSDDPTPRRSVTPQRSG